MVLVVGWFFVFGVVGALIGARKGEAVGGFLISALLGPIGLVITALSGGYRTSCPHCRERIMRDATICPHCRSTLPSTDAATVGSKPFLRRPAVLVALGVVLLAFLVAGGFFMVGFVAFINGHGPPDQYPQQHPR